MTSLKQEMRELFDLRSGVYQDRMDPLGEEGILAKISSFAFRNLHIYDKQTWEILSIRSKVHLQKLYRITGDPLLAVSSAALVACSSGEAQPEARHRTDLLCMSFMFAAKYYFIDFHSIREFDKNAVAREFAIAGGKIVNAILCLGNLNSSPEFRPVYRNPTFSDIIKEI